MRREVTDRTASLRNLVGELDAFCLGVTGSLRIDEETLAAGHGCRQITNGPEFTLGVSATVDEHIRKAIAGDIEGWVDEQFLLQNVPQWDPERLGHVTPRQQRVDQRRVSGDNQNRRGWDLGCAVGSEGHPEHEPDRVEVPVEPDHLETVGKGNGPALLGALR